MPYPEFTELESWIRQGGYPYSRTLYIEWFSFQDFPWSIYDWRNEVQKATEKLNDNYLSVRYLSFVYAKSRKDLPQVVFSDKDKCSLKFEAVVKSNKNLKKYIEIVQQIMGDDIAAVVTGEFDKEVIGQTILWQAKTSDVISYAKKQYPKQHGVWTFKDYCEERGINMDKINYTI